MTLRISLAVALLLVLSIKAETVQLASCPEEPEVVGKYYNNGYLCVRDRQVVDRTNQEANCPDDFAYKRGWCRRRFHPKVKPTCPTSDWTLNHGVCYSPCPTPQHNPNGLNQCVLRRSTLPPKYMTCHDDTRHGAYCCSPGKCPKPECHVDQAPGKFFYEDGTCVRQAEALARVVLPKSYSSDVPCPAGKIEVMRGCQDPCPDGYRALKGKCELRPCKFTIDRADSTVKCPEGRYKLQQALI